MHVSPAQNVKWGAAEVARDGVAQEGIPCAVASLSPASLPHWQWERDGGCRAQSRGSGHPMCGGLVWMSEPKKGEEGPDGEVTQQRMWGSW